MTLDIDTLLTLMLANVFVMAVAVPAVMGWRVSTSARFVPATAVAQALAWACFLLARPVNDRIFSTLWIALLGTSFVLMWHALQGWLGPRPGRRLLFVTAVLTPLGYGAGFDSYAFRVGWANLGLAILMGLVCLACAWPAPHSSKRWRGLIAVCLGALAVVTLGRGVLGAFFTEFYPSLRSPHPINIVGSLLNHIAITLSTIGLLVGWHEEADRELRRQAGTDDLTGLLNRRAWLPRVEEAVTSAHRYGEPLSVLMLDLDHFKRINDEGGHAAGDRALQLAAAIFRDGTRRGDLFCRYGGEEFCLLLVRADAQAALSADERLRETLRERSLLELGRALTFSSGVTSLRDDDVGIEDLLRRADAALYEAKAAGRDRAVCADVARSIVAADTADEQAIGEPP